MTTVPPVVSAANARSLLTNLTTFDAATPGVTNLPHVTTSPLVLKAENAKSLETSAFTPDNSDNT